jgi:VWFA-related protein
LTLHTWAHYNFDVKKRVTIYGLLFAACAALLPVLSAGQQSAPPPPPQQQQEQKPDLRTQTQRELEQIPAIRAEVSLVNVIFTVLNRRNRFVTDLERGNFKVFEDNRPQSITNFSRETGLPLRIVVLLDTSNSIRDRLQFEKDAAIDFLANVVRRRKDQAMVMTFDNEPQVIQGFTDDVGALSEAIMKQRAGGATALYDAIYVAARDYLSKAPPSTVDNLEVRRVLVVISDGEDTMPSQRTRSEALEMALRADVVIYTISTSTDWMSITGSEPKKYHKTDGDKVLELLADEGGGRAFFPYRIDDLAQSFLDISTELRSQYSLAYVPENKTPDGRYRKIRIETDRKGLIIRARKGYFAPRAPAKVSGQ